METSEVYTRACIQSCQSTLEFCTDKEAVNLLGLSLFHTNVLTLTEEISEPDLFRINLNFETICNTGYLH